MPVVTHRFSNDEADSYLTVVMDTDTGETTFAVKRDAVRLSGEQVGVLTAWLKEKGFELPR